MVIVSPAREFGEAGREKLAMEMKFWLAIIGAAAMAAAQQGGAVADWDARRDIPALPGKVKKLLPLLEQLQPQEWISKGASDAYVHQLKSIQAEAGYLQQTVDALAKQPEKLPVILEAYFRLQAIDTRTASLIEGVRKYQNPALADLLQSIAAENGSVRIGLQEYVLEIAAQREAEWRVMESEAQRCRTTLTAPGAQRTPKQ